MNREKSLVKNSVYSVLYKVLNVFFPLITAVYTARILLAEGVGKVSHAQNIVQYFIMIASLGIPNYGIREIAKNKGDKEKTSKIFTELFLINCFSTTICVIGYFSMILCVEYFRQYEALLLAVGISLVLNYINVDWFYQGKEEFAYIAIRNFIVKLFSLALLFLFVKNTNDYINYAIINCIATTGNYVFNIFNLKGKVQLKFQGISITRHIRPVLILLASSISIELYTLVDITMLGIYCSDSIVGYYYNSTRFARIINSVISSIALVLLPRLSYYYRSGLKTELENIVNRVLHILIVLALPASIGISILANDIICIFFGEAFFSAIPTLRILSVLVAAVALNNYFGTQILLTFNREMDLLKSVVIGAGINVILNLILIPKYFHNGAAIASVVSEMSVLLATYLFARKQIRFKISMRFWITLILSVLLMTIAELGILMLNLPMMIEMILGIVMGVCVYGTCGLLMKNQGIIELYNAIKKLFVDSIKKLQ